MGHKLDQWIDSRRPRLAKSAWKFAEDKDIQPQLSRLDPTALRTLLGAFSHASCVEEARIVLRYQHGKAKTKDKNQQNNSSKEKRNGEPSQQDKSSSSWTAELVQAMEKEFEVLLHEHANQLPKEEDSDRAQAMLIATWFGYVTQLHRYLNATCAEAKGAAANED